MPRGRPRSIESPEQFDALVDEYVEQCEEKDVPVTLTGMILHLGLSSRQSLDRYQQYDGFSDCVKRAKLYVELAYEMRLNGDKPTGAIFALKNLGWRDRVEQDHTSSDGSLSGVSRVEIEVIDGTADQGDSTTV